MSRIDEIVRELCPGGVRMQALGDLGEFIRGSGLQKKDFTDSGVGCIHYGQIFTHYGLWATKTKSFVSHELALSLKKARSGALVIATTSENDDDVCKAVAWLGDESIALSGDELAFEHALVPKYAAYVFQSSQFQAQKRRHISGTKVRRVSRDALKTIRIPVPPTEVQQEIVAILDTFVELEKELEAELVVRRNQHSSLAQTVIGAPHMSGIKGHPVERVHLGEVARQYIDPFQVEPDVTYSSLGVKWYGGGTLAREPKLGNAIKGKTLYRVKSGQLVYNRMFVTEGSFAVLGDEAEDGVVSNEFPVFDLDTGRVLPEWLLLYLLDEYTLKRIAGEVTGTERGSTKSRRRWKENQFEAFQVELPSLPDQQEYLRVVGGLTDLEVALNEEVRARQQQYAFYRDKLLAFEQEAS